MRESMNCRFGPNFKKEIQGSTDGREIEKLMTELTCRVIWVHLRSFCLNLRFWTTILCFLWFNHLNLWYFWVFHYFIFLCHASWVMTRIVCMKNAWVFILRSYWPVRSWRFNGSLKSRPKFGTLSASIHPLSICSIKFARGSFWQIQNCRKRKRQKLM